MSERPSRRAYWHFILSNGLKGILWLGTIIGAYLLADYLLPAEWNAFLKPFTDRPGLMFGIFFLSETFTGLIPLELFVIWAAGQPVRVYVGYVALMAVLSFAGGSIAYLIGRWIKEWPRLARITQWDTFVRNAELYRRWGGIIIILACLTPLPFAIICFLSGTFHFPYRRFLLYASLRFVRFAVVGWVLMGL